MGIKRHARTFALFEHLQHGFVSSLLCVQGVPALKSEETHKL